MLRRRMQIRLRSDVVVWRDGWGLHGKAVKSRSPDFDVEMEFGGQCGQVQ